MGYKQTSVGLIPFHWEVVKIQEIGEVIGGGTPSTKKVEYYGGDIPWITPRDLSGYQYKRISKGERSITIEGLDNSSAQLLPYNSVLLSSRAPIGYVAIADNELTTNQGFKSVVCDKDKVLPDYLYYLLKISKERLESVASGSTFKEVSATTVKNFEIALPPMHEQIHIVNILSKLDDKIELNSHIIANLEKTAQTLFKHWFVDFEFPNKNGEPYKSSGGKMVESELGMIPEGWEIQSLDEIANFQNGYAFKSKELTNRPTENSYSVFKMGNIKKGGGLNDNGTKDYFDKEKTHGLEKYILKKGDLLMCMTDMKSNVALLGHTALMNKDNKYIQNQRVGLIRTKNCDVIDYPYLYLLTNSDEFIKDLRGRANSGVQVNLSTKEIKKSLLILPEKNVHAFFHSIVNPLFENKFLLKQENQNLESIRDTLLPKLLSGEIELPDETEVTEHVSI